MEEELIVHCLCGWSAVSAVLACFCLGSIVAFLSTLKAIQEGGKGK